MNNKTSPTVSVLSFNKAEREPEEVIEINEAEFDHTVFDFSDKESVVITQTDEAGVTHTVILSPEMVAKVQPQMFRWKAANQI